VGGLFAVQWTKSDLSHHRDVLSSKKSKQYEARFGLGSFATGLEFGGLSLLLVTDLSLTAQFMIPFVIAGATAGAIVANVGSLLNY